MRLEIKPLSVNEAFKGRRFKTDLYKNYERAVMLMLDPMKVPKGDLVLNITFGFSSSASDVDNPVKPFVDILQKKYKFNDNQIVEMHLYKLKVKKGEEFIQFFIEQKECFS